MARASDQLTPPGEPRLRAFCFSGGPVEEINIATPVGWRTANCAWRDGSLAVTEVRPGMWTLTHVLSGRRVPWACSSPVLARLVAEWLVPRIDWSAPWEDVVRAIMADPEAAEVLRALCNPVVGAPFAAQEGVVEGEG